MPTDLETIEAAIKGDRGGDQKRIAEQCVATAALILRKNADYGCSVWKSPTLLPKLSPSDAILVRMGDKVDRLQSLLSRDGKGEVDESIADTIADLSAYGLLYLARPTS